MSNFKSLSNEAAFYLADALRGHAEALDRNTQAQLRPLWSIRQLRDWWGGMNAANIRVLCAEYGYVQPEGAEFRCPLEVVLKVEAARKKGAA
ncbi:hypothetical protein JXA32_16085 [Candidatus Sumerlaeota bacterium]|nr:hypothetical protein [Candidatus Sumerlaeota bacterium]